MTPEEQQAEIRRRQRSRAIITGILLGGLVILFYAVTFVKMGMK